MKYTEEQWYDEIGQTVLSSKHKAHILSREAEKQSELEKSSRRSSKASSKSDSSSSSKLSASNQNKATELP